MSVAFTICSNNYIGQANALKKSYLYHNPKDTFVFVVIDKPSGQINYDELQPATLIFIEDITSISIEPLLDRYDIIELNTCVKPSVFKFLISQFPNIQKIYYLDPDLFFYNSLKECNDLLETKSIVLTPHILSKIKRDKFAPSENTFLNFGIYNLGFLGINTKHKDAIKMLDWWEYRTLNHGYIDLAKGYFVDQLWMNFAPLFYNDVHILKSFNYNMAPWNLHERTILKKEEDKWILNDNSTLVFYHFSKISENESDVSRVYNRYSLGDLPQLKVLYSEYKKALQDAHFYKYKSIPIAFKISSWKIKKEKNRSFLKRVFRKVGKTVLRLTE